MASFKIVSSFVLALGLAACGGGSNNADSGHDAATTNNDSATGHDGTSSNDSGGTASYGTCGTALHDCQCTCAINNPDGGADTCFTTTCDPMITDQCTTCEVQSWRTCCPDESTALGTCIQNAEAADGGTPTCAQGDNDCLEAHCGDAETTLNNCLNVKGPGGTAPVDSCIAAYRTCFGDDATADGTIMCAQ